MQWSKNTMIHDTFHLGLKGLQDIRGWNALKTKTSYFPLPSVLLFGTSIFFAIDGASSDWEVLSSPSGAGPKYPCSSFLRGTAQWMPMYYL